MGIVLNFGRQVSVDMFDVVNWQKSVSAAEQLLPVLCLFSNRPTELNDKKCVFVYQRSH